jgi:hypothetical protein
MTRRKILLAGLAIVGLASFPELASGQLPSWWPMSGLDLIPDESTAINVAIPILERYYGKEFVQRHAPYRASLQGDEWTIGPADSPQKPLSLGGGHPEMSLSKKDARVIRIALAR